MRRDTILPFNGHPLIDVPGGGLAYAAAGLAVWHRDIGLVGRVGEDYPHEWLLSFTRHGMDIRGLQVVPQALDLCFFVAYPEPGKPQYTNPIAHFARLGLTFPKSLLGYQPAERRQDSRFESLPASPRPADIPSAYLQAQAVHLCPMDFVAHRRLALAFQQAKVKIQSIDPGAGYMNTAFWDDMRDLLRGVTAFIPCEQELRDLFWGRTDDPWQMAEALCGDGCEMVVIKCGARGQLLYEGASHKRWEIPAYPARLVDPIGAGDAFCGGFLAGYQLTSDPLQAVLHGNISASLAIEGSGVFQVLETLPGLAQARLDSLSGLVRCV